MLFKHNLFYGLHFSPDTGGGNGGAGAATGGDDNGDGDEGGNPDAGDGDSGEEDDELTGLKTALDKERTDRKAAQKDLRALKKQIADLEKGGNGEGDEKSLEEAVKRAETAEARLRDANARVAITDAATKAGASNVKAVLRYVMSDVEFDENGNPVDIEDLIESAKEEVPQLFTPARTPSADGGKGRTVSNQDMNSLIRRAAGRK